MGLYKYYDPVTGTRKPIKSGSIVNMDGTNEYTPDEVKEIDDKIGILSGTSGTKEKANKEDLDSHLADLASQEVGKGASLIGLNDDASNFESTNVEGALDELFTNVSDGKQLVGTAITELAKKVNRNGDTMTGILKVQSNTAYATAQVRNIILSPNNADSSLMQNGEIWIKYE